MARLTCLLVMLNFYCITFSPLKGQMTTDEFNQKAKESQLLSVKLFPDCTVATSPLVQAMIRMDNDLKASGSAIYFRPEKPLILTVECGKLLQLTPQWSSLTDNEKNLVYLELVSALANSRDLTDPTPDRIASPQQTPQPPVMPAILKSPRPIGQVGEVMGPIYDAAERQYQYELQEYAIKMGLPPPSYASPQPAPSDNSSVSHQTVIRSDGSVDQTTVISQ